MLEVNLRLGKLPRLYYELCPRTECRSCAKPYDAGEPGNIVCISDELCLKMQDKKTTRYPLLFFAVFAVHKGRDWTRVDLSLCFHTH